MKNNFLILLRNDLKAITASLFKRRKNGAKNTAAILFIVLLGAYLLYSVTQTFNAVFEIAKQMDFLEMGFIYGGIISFAFLFIQALSQSQDKLYKAKDLQTLLTLPINEKHIFLSKSLAILLSGYLFFGLIYISMMTSYFIVFGFSVGALFVSILLFFVVPFVPFGLGLLCGKLVSMLTVNAKQRGLVSGIIYFLIFAVFMVAMMGIQFFPSFFFENATLYSILKVVMYRSVLITGAMTGNILNLLFVVLLSLGLGALLLYLSSLRYLKIARSFGEQNFKSKNVGYAKKSVVRTMLKKEARRYLSSSIYIFNTYFGMIILIVGCIALMFVPFDLFSSMPEMIITVISFLVAMSCTTSASISLEGQSFYSLKSLPINLKTWLNVKSLFNIVIVAIPAVLACVLLLAKYGAVWYVIVLGCVYIVGVSVFIAELGLFANILFPKLDFQDDTSAVKRSISVMIAVLVSIVVVAILESISIAFVSSLWALIFKLGIILVLGVTLFTLNRTYGARKVRNL